MIYPEIKLPTIKLPEPSHVEHKFAPQFDFEVGEFLFDTAGRPLLGDSFEDWVLKVCMTERNTRLAYSDKIGVELQDLAQEPNVARAKSKIIRTITEAVRVHPRTVSVKNFSIKIQADEVRAAFEVNGKRLEVSL